MKLRAWHAAGAFAIIAGAFVLLRAGASPAESPHVDWPSGKEITYALNWQTSTETAGLSAVVAAPKGEDEGREQAPLRSGVNVVGDIVLRSYGKRGDDYLVTAQFGHLSKVSVSAFDQALLPDLDKARGELEGHRAELVVKPTGEITDVRFSSHDPALFRYLMQAVLTELSISVKAGPDGAGPKVEEHWSADLDGPAGRGPASFARDPKDPFSFSRTRARYDSVSAWPDPNGLPRQNLTSKGSFTLAKSGTLDRITDEETFEAARDGADKDVVAKTSFSLEKKSERMLDPNEQPPTVENPVSAKDPPSEDDAAREKRLAARTEGVTVDTILDDVKVSALVPKGKNGRWAWIAKGYFELHPEKTDELVTKMRGLDRREQGYAIDLLVMTAHEQAQASIVRAFSDGTILPGRDYAMLVQRVGHLKTPTKATAAFFSQRYAAARMANDIPAWRATAITVGALASHVAERDREEARAMVDPLVIHLYAVKDPGERESLLLAVGNASFPEDASAIRLYAHDDSPNVRRSVASALRRIDTKDVRGTLIELSGDKIVGVQRMALSSLDRKALDDDDLMSLADQVKSGHLDDDSAATLVSILQSRREGHPKPVIEMLDAIAARPGIPSDARSRAISLRDGTR